MPTVAEQIASLEEAIPPTKAAGWDAVGLQVGDPGAAASVIAVCHEVTGAVIEAARRADADLIVSYHPLLFRPANSFVAGASASGRAFALAVGGVALYVVHTAFDVVAGGCADALADALGLGEVRPFGVNWPDESSKIVTFVPQDAANALTAAMAAAGAGEVGRYSECSFSVEGTGSYRPGNHTSPYSGATGELSREPELRVEMNLPRSRVDAVVAALAAAHPYDEPAFDVYATEANAGFVGRVGDLAEPTPLADVRTQVAAALGSQVKSAGDLAASVTRVAVVPGSGGDLIGAAAAAGAEAIVTGDVSHHRAREALGRGLAVIDAGHAATERPGVARLYSLVSTLFDNVVDLTGLDPSPWEVA